MFKLYRWKYSEALKNYSTGDLIAMAETVHLARQQIRDAAIVWLKNDRSWVVLDDGKPDPFYQEEWDEFFAKLEADLLKDHEIVECGAILIRGSE